MKCILKRGNGSGAVVKELVSIAEVANDSLWEVGILQHVFREAEKERRIVDISTAAVWLRCILEDVRVRSPRPKGGLG